MFFHLTLDSVNNPIRERKTNRHVTNLHIRLSTDFQLEAKRAQPPSMRTLQNPAEFVES